LSQAHIKKINGLPEVHLPTKQALLNLPSWLHTDQSTEMNYPN